jgi:DNA-binding winged helix-turn-helix (wHTH) protein/TolB-like protein/Tfp pilus assembly protein PilF
MSSRSYQFGNWSVEPQLNRISSSDGEKHLEPLTMDVLCHLLEHPGETISSETILATVWNGRVVEVNAVPRAISQIRDALEDDSRDPCYIETIRRRGYRAKASVRKLGTVDTAIPSNRRVVAALAAVVSLIALGLILTWSENEGRSTPALDRSISMLPFTVAGNDAAAETYARALVEELRSVITSYAEIHIVAVPEIVDPQEIDQASYVLGGNVQRLGERMRLRAHLTRTDDHHIVWANAFEDSVSNGVIDPAETANTVGRFVRLQLIVDPQCESVRRMTASKDAADAYCVALTEVYRGAQIGSYDLQLVLNSLQRAIALDPTIAQAHLLIGYTYFQLGENGEMHWQEATQQARAALDRRLALAPDDAETHGLRGRIEQFEMDYPDAELSFRAALASDPLDPTLSPILSRLGMLALTQGDVAEAIEHSRRAVRLNDSNAIMYMALGRSLWFAGEYREAIKVVDAGLPLVNSGYTYANLLVIKIAAYDALGDRSRANETLNEALASVGSEWKPQLAPTLASLGRSEEAKQLVLTLEEFEQPPVDIVAEAYAALGDERAFEWIHKAIDRHRIFMITELRASPVYSELRKDPRWADVASHLEAEEAKGRALFNDPE